MTQDSDPKTINSVEDALKAINTATQNVTYTVWIPSLQKEVPFREINTKQQKALLQSVIDSPLYKTRFIIAIHDILKENYLGQENFETLTILDKLLIILKTRIECFSSQYDSPTNDQIKQFDLNSLYEAGKQIKIPEDESLNTEDYNISLVVGVPTVLNEYTLEKESHKNIEFADVTNADQLRSTIGDIFIGEISKFVKEIKFAESSIKLEGLPFNKRISILEKLPNKLIQKVIQYIDNIKNLQDQITTVKLKQGDNEVEEAINIDGTFFALK